ncbi:hypothetical protein [Stackebrandtia soli]|uniref:hypothetical protein n=1 Tax=Stackebrandtia soli TaxID=1892856 RepID=UPI0039E99949
MNDAAQSSAAYTGPPTNVRPPAGWKVPEVVRVAPPRELPEQDPAAINEAETRATTLTYGMGILFGSLMLVVLIVVLARAVT